MPYRIEGNLAKDKRSEVIVIEASPEFSKAKLRVAAYARVSSDSADQLNSFGAQTRYYQTLFAGNDTWEMVDIYADEGITGTSAEKRPDFQRLLHDCRQGRIDRVLVKSVSRFARNTKECLEIIRELKAIGVSVYFEEQRIDTGKVNGELLTTIFASLAQGESESISGNMRWSYKQRMEKGRFIGCSAPLGYRLVNGTLEIIEEEAKIVRMIFDLYLEGYNTIDIARHLTELGIPTGTGNPRWYNRGVAYILSNERYMGDALLQKTYTTDALPFKRRMNDGARDQYYITDSHPPIIDRNSFMAAQELLQKRSENMSRSSKKDHLLAKRIICGDCGSTFKYKINREIAYWVCYTHYQDGEDCPVLPIPESAIQDAFLRIYHKMRFHGIPILKQMVTDLRAVRERKMLWSEDIIQLNIKISEITDQNRMLAEMNKQSLVDSDFFISKKNELEAELRAAKREKAKLLDAKQDDSIAKTEELIELLDTMPEFLPAFDGEIFDDLVERIRVQDNNTLIFQLKNGLELKDHWRGGNDDVGTTETDDEAAPEALRL